MNTFTWYAELKKPSWAPPSWVFGPAWTFLYILIAISFGRVFISAWSGEIPSIIALPFILNLIFNFAFSPIQFGMQNNALAAVDCICILITLIFATVIIFPIIPFVAYMQIPYLLWVSFATILQLTITYLNR